MASAVDSRLAYARPSAVATASRLPTATRGSNNSYTTSWDTTVIVAANAIGTPRLLLMSAAGRFPNGLANSSGLVGKRLMLHPFGSVIGLYEEELQDWLRPAGTQIECMQFYATDVSRGLVRGSKWHVMGTGGPIEMATRWLIGEGVGDEAFWDEPFARKMRQAVNHSIDWIVHVEDLPEESNSVTLDPSQTDSDGLPGVKITYVTSQNTHRSLDFALTALWRRMTRQARPGRGSPIATSPRDITLARRAWATIPRTRSSTGSDARTTCPISTSSTAASFRPPRRRIRPRRSVRWRGGQRPTSPNPRAVRRRRYDNVASSVDERQQAILTSKESWGMSTVELAAMEEWTARVLVHSGLSESDAECVARNLAFAESRGLATHGFLRLPVYVDRVTSGGINKDARFRIDRDVGALVIVDADHGAGAASGVYAADLAVERANIHGIGCAIARNANHFGASAFFTNRIADAGLVGIAMCNTESVMCAPFGGRPVLGTNPLAVAVPLPSDKRPQLDMATRTASQGKLIMAEQAGEPVPLGWAVDTKGRPTESAAGGLAGALLPSGGPKGFGIAFAIDTILAVAGARVSHEVGALRGEASEPQRLGHAFIALRADVVGSLAEYRQRVTSLVDAIHDSGVEEQAAPLAPGEPELIHVHKMDGRFELGGELVKNLRRLADSAGIALPEQFSAAS